MPKPKQKVPLNAIMLMYEILGDSTEVYFIPDGNLLDKEVRQAMRKARNTYSNGGDLTTEQQEAHDVLSAAMTDSDNAQALEHRHLPFAGAKFVFTCPPTS